jgi:hypothetical protein
MKKFIVSFIAYMMIINVSGAIYNIGNHEIHYDNSIYFKIYLSDTFRIDTSTFIIKYYSGTEGGAITTIENNNGLIRKHEFITGYISYNYNNGMDFISMCTNLTNETAIEVLELNCEVKYLCDPMIPDDDEYGQQWYLETIKAPLAWNITTGDENVVVGILDTGFDWEHDDLGPGSDVYESSYLNPYEDAWTTWNDPCTGDKSDGDQVPNYTNKPDDWKGWSAERDNPCPPNYTLENDTREYDRDYLIANYTNGESLWRHGTFIAGIIGGKTNNGTDIAGIAGGWGDKGVSLLYVQTGVNDHPPGIFTSHVVNAIEYCIMHGGQWDEEVNVIQMAFSTDENQNMKDMLNEAYNQGIFLVASAGNGYGANVDFPANWDKVFAVGATGIDDYVMPISNYGNELDLCAPGEDILGIIPFHTAYPNTFDLIQGRTSAASAMVSGTVGLMLSVKPDLTNTEIKEILHESADKVHPDNPYYYENGFYYKIGYGRLNTYKAVCLTWEAMDDVEVNGTVTWSTPNSYVNSVIVTSGSELTITAEIQFGPNAALIIEPGATVKLDGGTLTNHDCCENEDKMWIGVQVWGNSDETQITNHYYPDQHQGKLEMMNNAVIEHAKIAVDLWEPGNDDGTGGIIIANDAIFRNNNRAVHAMPYENFYPPNQGNIADNISYFKYCTFEITGDYLAELDFYKHVDLVQVDGIKFKACDFSVQAGVPGVSNWTIGLAAYSAGFDVQAVCANPNQYPCTNFDKCTFTGFNKGINAVNTSSTYTFTVNRADFNNNTAGIYASLVNNFSVLFSNFNVGKNAADEEECESKGQKASGYGIDLTGCTGFAIEENYFTPGTTGGYFTGIRIANTEATDEVYKNYFDGLSYGNYAVGKNWFSNEYWNGLAYYCNENTGNWDDFTVEAGNPSGIQDPIGSVEMPAGNTFSANANYNFYNDGNYWIGYYYYAPTPGNTSTPYYPEEVYQVTREEVVGIQNECPSHYGGGGSVGDSGRGMVLTPEERQQAEQDFATNLTDYNNVKALYDNLKDGGNTEATITDVETAWPDDMWELRAELLVKSPHLSMDVLKAAADKTEVLPESIIFEIMAANPDELKKEELIEYLENKENPLPDYMIDILKQVSTGTTYKTVLHRQMAHYNQLKTRVAHDIIRSLLNDTVTDYAELRNWFDNVGGKRADEQVIATYVQERNYTDALSLANMMPVLYGYEDDELTEHNYYTDMLNLQISLDQEGRTIFDLDSDEVNNLVFIADNSNGTAGIQAKGILKFAYGYHYYNCINADTLGYKSSSSINFDGFNKVFGPDIEVKPNPAKEWTSFNFILPDNEIEGMIKISNVTGKIIETFVVKGTQGQKIWDTRKIKPGVYLYTFTVNGISKSGKIVISK